MPGKQKKTQEKKERMKGEQKEKNNCTSRRQWTWFRSGDADLRWIPTATKAIPQCPDSDDGEGEKRREGERINLKLKMSRNNFWEQN